MPINKEDKEFEELVESYINGNIAYVTGKIIKFQKKKIINFFFYMENNRDWLCSDAIFFDILNSLRNRLA